MYQYYFHPMTRRLALLCAVPVLIVALFLTSPLWAVILTAATTLALSLLLFPLWLWIADRPYRRVGKLLPARVLFRDRILLRLPKDRACNACLYLYQNGAVICALQKGAPILLTHLPRKCVWQVQLQEHLGQLRFCFYDNFFYEFYCTREEALLSFLRKTGWNVGEPPQG